MTFALRVEPIACLKDNYAWLVTSDASPREAVVVDPGEAAPVVAELSARSLTLSAIVITHHHHDHVGGIEGVLDKQPRGSDVRVVAGHIDVQRCRVPHASVALKDDDTLDLLGRTWHALWTPGHTLGATSYHVPDASVVFTGDTLFLAGCGRLLEGDAQSQYASLLRLCGLPEATAIYCGHEYTEKNLAFSSSVLPRDADIARARAAVAALRRGQRPSVPGRVRDERRHNLFFRCHDVSVAAALGARPGLETFVALRNLRDNF